MVQFPDAISLWTVNTSIVAAGMVDIGTKYDLPEEILTG